MNRTNETRTPPLKQRSQATNSRQRNYNRFLPDSGRGWGSRTGDFGEEDEDNLGYDEDEDEFGLPSLAGARKASDKRKSSPSLSLADRTPSGIEGVAQASLWRVNSGDIAEERGLPSYPSARHSEGKILRPQYKDILRGRRTSDSTVWQC